MEEKTVHIPNISCGHCTMTIEREIGELNGVSFVKGNVDNKTVLVKWSPPQSWKAIQLTLDEIGYTPEE